MPAKSKKTKKQKRAPVRIISPQTVEMPPDNITTVTKEEKQPLEQKPDITQQSKPVLLLGELKRIGIVFALILFILVLASLIF